MVVLSLLEQRWHQKFHKKMSKYIVIQSW